MKLASSLLTLTLAFSAFAEPIPNQKRALADYTGVFDKISTQVGAVSDSVASYVGGSTPGTDVQDAANTLVDVINDGATSVSGFDPLSNSDALALVSPIQTLTGDVGDLVDSVIDAKPNFDSDELSADVLSSLQAQKTAAEALRDAVTPKVPEALQDTAAELAEGIVTEINRGITAYS